MAEGIPSARIAWFAATTSASVEEIEVTVCLQLKALIGKYRCSDPRWLSRTPWCSWRRSLLRNPRLRTTIAGIPRKGRRRTRSGTCPLIRGCTPQVCATLRRSPSTISLLWTLGFALLSGDQTILAANRIFINTLLAIPLSLPGSSSLFAVGLARPVSMNGVVAFPIVLRLSLPQGVHT